MIWNSSGLQNQTRLPRDVHFEIFTVFTVSTVYHISSVSFFSLTLSLLYSVHFENFMDKVFTVYHAMTSFFPLGSRLFLFGCNKILVSSLKETKVWKRSHNSKSFKGDGARCVHCATHSPSSAHCDCFQLVCAALSRDLSHTQEHTLSLCSFRKLHRLHCAHSSR
jgi:hypothetical protein